MCKFLCLWRIALLSIILWLNVRPYKSQDKCRINLLIYRGDGASLKKDLFFSVWQPGQAIQNGFQSRNYSWRENAPQIDFLKDLVCVNVNQSGGAYRLPKLATPIHWINPSYLLIKSSNHGLDPFHWFVSRHGRAEGHRNAVLVNPRCEAGADRLIYAWKYVPKRWERTKGASIFPFL